MADNSNEPKNYEGIKAFLIARVSDPSQRQALPAQELRINEYAQWKLMNAELHSFDETAFKEDRDKFGAIVNKIKKYPEECVVVFDKIDRFTRDCTSDVVRVLKSAVKDGRIELHFPSDGLYVRKHSPATDWFRLDMGMALGGYYSQAISDNVRRRIAKKLKDGEYPGKACIGYLNVKEIIDGKEVKNIVPDPDRKGYIVRAYELRLEGKSFRTITKILKSEGFRSNTVKHSVVGQSQIEAMLKKPFYYGVMKYDGKLYPHKYESIISKRTFDMVQLVNDHKATDWTKTDIKKVFTFSGVLKCANCGCTISSYEQKGHVYMRCTKSKNLTCDQPHVSEAELLPQVVVLLESLRLSENILNQVIGVLKSEHDNIQSFYNNAIKQTRDEYHRLQKKMSVLYEDRLDGRITVADYDKYVTKTKAAMDDLDRKLVEFTNNDKSFVVTSEYLLKLASQAKQLFESSQPDKKNKILKTLLANCLLDQKKLQPYLLEPFSALSADVKNDNWLRRSGSNRRPIR